MRVHIVKPHNSSLLNILLLLKQPPVNY